MLPGMHKKLLVALSQLVADRSRLDELGSRPYDRDNSHSAVTRSPSIAGRRRSGLSSFRCRERASLVGCRLHPGGKHRSPPEAYVVKSVGGYVGRLEHVSPIYDQRMLDNTTEAIPFDAPKLFRFGNDQERVG